MNLLTTHQGDCLDILPTLDAGSVQCVVTSPPYYGLRDYGLPPTAWPDVSYSPMAGLPELTIPAMSCCLGLEPSPEAYTAHLVHVFRLVWDVLREDGAAWLNLGDSYWGGKGQSGSQGKEYQQLRCITGKSFSSPEAHVGGHGKTRPTDGKHPGLKPKDLIGTPSRVVHALQADGWWWRSPIIWEKPNCMPESVQDRPTLSHEYIFLLAKSSIYYYDGEAIKVPIGDNLPWGRQTLPQKDKHARAWQGHELSRDERIAKYANGRNRRTVWRVATQPYSEAHFAVYPPGLIEPCILAGTSARGCCPECGAPWERVTEREFVPQEDVSREKGIRGASGQKPMDQSSRWQGYPRGTTSGRTLGWCPGCDCYGVPRELPDYPEEPETGGPTAWCEYWAECERVRHERERILVLWNEQATVPCTVLDPFAGSGTTGRVAVKHGRRAVLIELNAEYVELQRARTTVQMALPE